MTNCPEREGVPDESYPCIRHWLTEHGTIEFGYCPYTNTFIRVLDEGGVIWKGRARYTSFDLALTDCEAGIRKWLRKEMGEEV